MQKLQDIIKDHISVNAYNYYMNYINYHRLNQSDRLLLEKNSRLKNMYAGRRCFILGNGHSLRDIDFTLLKNEYVFTCNNIVKVDGYEKLEYNFHIWADMAYFGKRKDMSYNLKEVIADMKSMVNNENALFFLPMEGYTFFTKKVAKNCKNLHVYGIGLELTKKFPIKFDLTRYLANATTVVQYAIMIALYMGFSEIYLAGIDSTNIKFQIDTALDIEVNHMHAYSDEKDNTKDNIKQVLKHWNLDDLLYEQYLLFRNYRYLYYYCKRNHVKIYNLSTTTLVDSIPRKSIFEILK